LLLPEIYKSQDDVRIPFAERDRAVESVLRPTLEKLCNRGGDLPRSALGKRILSPKSSTRDSCLRDLRGGFGAVEGFACHPAIGVSVSFAILNGKKTTTQQAFGMGANLVLQKPISALNASRCFNASLDFMVRERRRYFRQR